MEENIYKKNHSSVRDYLTLARQAATAGGAMDTVRAIAQYHRIQASPGYRAAAQHCAGILERGGVRTELISYPAAPSLGHWSQGMFQEWDCQTAYLTLKSPWEERLCDFESNDMSILQRSAPADWRDRELPIVYVPDGQEPEAYDGDLSGALLFVENGVDRWIEQAAALGAVGVLTVSMPEIAPVRTGMSEDPELMDQRANLSFHRTRGSQAGGLFGFALTPSQGKRLRKACLALAAGGSRPMAHAYVDARFYDGTAENVQAVLPGTGKEEILIVAHLCHPKSSVNDNASGAACAIQAMTTLCSLIDGGELPRPARSIRLLLVPEFTGTYAYLEQQEKRGRLDCIRAGVNLDLVGGRQDGHAGPFLVVGTPDAPRSFVGDLARVLLDELGRECPLGELGEHVALFQSAVKPYMPGSDHYILSDPTVNIPCVALTQWPDKFYHTSGDCLDRLDPDLLDRVSAFTAAYAYALAVLSPAQAGELLFETRQRFFTRMTALAGQSLPDRDRQEAAAYLKEVALDTCQSYLAFFPQGERAVEDRVRAERAYQRALFAATFPGLYERPPRPGPVPARACKGPPAMRSLLARCTKAQRAEYRRLRRQFSGFERLDDYLVYAVNGRDSVPEIARRVQGETGIHCEAYALALVSFFCKIGYMKWIGESEV